jgi:hypothetical protein
VNFKELSLTLKAGVKWWSGTCFGVSAFRAGSPFTTLGPVSLVSDAKDALFETTKVSEMRKNNSLRGKKKKNSEFQ